VLPGHRAGPWGKGIFAVTLGLRRCTDLRAEGSRLTDIAPTSGFAYPAPAPTREADESPYAGLRLETWLKIGTVAGLFIALFWPNLRRLWDKTNPFYGEPNWGHAICVPIIGLYYLYANRDELLRQTVRVRWEGLVVMLGGILFYGWAIWPGQNDFFKDVGMVIALFGLVLLLTGWQVMRIVWFPIAYIVCAIPWPSLFYSRLASPLQQLAASVSVGVLRLTGVDAVNTGTKIRMLGQNGMERVLNVAEACAGLRSLMTFITLGAAVAFLSNRPLWQKVIITISAIPIAIFCNVMRVAGQGLLDYYVSHAWSEGFAHQFAGLVMLVPAFFLILLVAWCVDHLFIEEADEVPGVITVKRGVVAVQAVTSAAPTKAPAPVVAKTRFDGAQGSKQATVAAAPAKPKAVAPAAPKPAVQAPKPLAQAPKPVVQASKPVTPKPAAPKPVAPAAPTATQGFVVPLPGTANARAAQKRGKTP
jgi:exosortase